MRRHDSKHETAVLEPAPLSLIHARSRCGPHAEERRSAIHCAQPFQFARAAPRLEAWPHAEAEPTKFIGPHSRHAAGAASKVRVVE